MAAQLTVTPADEIVGLTPAGPQLGAATAVGAAWLALQTVGGRIVGFASQLVLAAILSPSDFGLIGLAYTISAVGALVSGVAVDSVLLQRHKTMRLWMVPAFWLSLGLGMLALLVVVAVAPVFARIYQLPAVVPLAAIIGVSMPFTAAGMAPTVLLRSQLRFRLIATIGLGEMVAIQALTIAFAVAGMGAYSFALPLPIVAAARTLFVWYLSPPNLSGLFRSAGRMRYLINSSAAVFATGIVQAAIGQGDYILLGVMGNEVAVGLYFFAFKLASQPLLVMAANLTNVLFPALSHMRNDQAAQANAALRAARLLALIVIPLAVLQASLIAPVMHLFFQAKWDGSIPPMQVLSIALGIDGVAWVAGALITARGEFWRQFWLLTAQAVPFFGLVTLGGSTGTPLGMALAVGTYYVVCTPVYTAVVFRFCRVPLGRLAAIYLIPLGLAAAAVGCGWLATRAMPGWMTIAVLPIIAVPLYAGLLRLVTPAGFAEVQILISHLTGKLRRKS